MIGVLATINADFTDQPLTTLSNVSDVLPGVMVGFVQEAKRLRGRWSLRDHLSPLLGVHQSTRSEALAGSAVVWDRARCKPVERGHWLLRAPEPGHRMLTRYIAWVDLVVDGTATFRFASAHRPRPLDRELWPLADDNLARFVRRSPHPVIVGMDANTAHLDIGVRGAAWLGHGGRDGFLFRGMGRAGARVVGEPFALPRTASDHAPVAVRVNFPEHR